MVPNSPFTVTISAKQDKKQEQVREIQRTAEHGQVTTLAETTSWRPPSGFQLLMKPWRLGSNEKHLLQLHLSITPCRRENTQHKHKTCTQPLFDPPT
ncbi:hypothetical protein CHARACLAT_022838, partial [Characodon lateralis]|nr:hypothetical protein [Characodon lateralis]